MYAHNWSKDNIFNLMKNPTKHQEYMNYTFCGIHYLCHRYFGQSWHNLRDTELRFGNLS